MRLWRRITSLILGIVAMLGVTVCAIGGWADRWVDTPAMSREATEAALADDEVTAGLAAHLSAEAVGLARAALLARAEEADARAVVRLEPWLTARLEAVLGEQFEERLRSEWIQRHVPGSVEAIHAAVVQVVVDDERLVPHVIVSDGRVAVDLLPASSWPT